MSQRLRSRWFLLFVALVGFSLVAAACGGTDDEPGALDQQDMERCFEGLAIAFGDGEGELVPGGTGDLDGSNLEFIHQLCATFGSEELTGLTVEVCADGRPFPELRRTETNEHVFWGHGVIRFHPTDELDNSGTNTFELSDPWANFLTSPKGAAVVLDTGEHLAFVSAVIEEMTGKAPEERELANYGSGAIIDESHIIEALGDIRPESFVNMSFGTYTCDDEGPPELRDQMAALADQGVQFVVSAGNDGTDQTSWPAGFGTKSGFVDSVTSVGSFSGNKLTSSGDTTRSCFSNYGSVEVWVPGEEVLPAPYVAADGSQGWHWSGTSFAAPQVLSLLMAGADLTEFTNPPAAPNPGPFNIEWTTAAGTTVTDTTFCAKGSGYEPVLNGLTYP